MTFSLRSTQLMRLIRYGATGIINTFVDFAIFGLLVGVANLQPFYANLLAFAAAVICSFLLNRNWTFGDRADAKPSPRREGTQLLIFVFCMSATALLCSWLLTVLTDAGLALPLAKIAVTLMSMLFNYVLMNRVIFRYEHTKPPLDGTAATRHH